MATAAIFSCLLLSVVLAVEGSKCPSVEEPSKLIVCYYEGTTEIEKLNICNCTHLVFTSIATVDDYNLTFTQDVKKNELAVLETKNLSLIFTVNLNAEQTLGVLKSEQKKIDLLNSISSFLRTSEFSGVELNFEFSIDDGARKEDLVSFNKDLRGVLNHHRVKRDGYSVFEDLQNDFTTGRYTTEKYVHLKSSTTKKSTVKRKKNRIPRDDKNVDFYDDDDSELSIVDEDLEEEPLLRRTKRRKQRVDEEGEVKEVHEDVVSADGYVIMIRLSITPEIIAKKFDLKALSKFVDYMMVPTHMITDESEKDVTFHPSRLMGLSDILNTDSILDLLTGLGAPKSKLIITMPASVLQYELKDATQNTARSPIVGRPKVITQGKMCSLLKTGEWTVERDEDLTAPYAFSKTVWLAFEDEISANIKGKYIILRELAGAAVYPIDSDTTGESCVQKQGGRISGVLQSNFGGLDRKPRQAVLESLQEQIHDTAFYSQEAGVHLSEYRIVRVVDHSGAVHVIRKNTKTEFECSRQGYFSHPLGCNKFYRCVKFNQYTDDYTVFEYDCPDGLAFDERWEVCVWPGSLPHGAPCTGSSEIAPVPRSYYQCPNVEGYYADPENCRWFFACLDHARDGVTPLTAYEFRCPFGLVFDENTLVCDWPWVVGGCGARGAAGVVLTRTGGASSYLGASTVVKDNGGYIAGLHQNRASFATVPDYVISGGRINNKEGGVILNQNIVGLGGLGAPAGIQVSTVSPILKTLQPPVVTAGHANIGLSSPGYLATPTGSSIIVDDGGSSHRGEGLQAVHVNPQSSFIAEDGGSNHRSEGLQTAYVNPQSSFIVEDGGSKHRGEGLQAVHVNPQSSSFIVEDGGSNHRGEGLQTVQVSTPAPLGVQNGGYIQHNNVAQAVHVTTPVPVYHQQGVLTNQHIFAQNPTVYTSNVGLVGHQDTLHISTPAPVAYGTKTLIQPHLQITPKPVTYQRFGVSSVGVQANTAPAQIGLYSNAVSLKPNFVQDVLQVRQYGEKIPSASTGGGYNYDKPAIAFELPSKNAYLPPIQPAVYAQNNLHYNNIEHVNIKTKPIAQTIVTPRPAVYAQQAVPVENLQPQVYQQHYVTPRPISYNQQFVQSVSPVVQHRRPIVVESHVTAQPIVYKQESVVTQRPIIYQQPSVSLKPVFYQKEIISPRPVLVQQHIATPRPTIIQQEISTTRPIIYHQEISPIATAKPVVYQQQYVTPKPVVYQQQYVTPKPVVYQQEIIQPVVTPKPVVYQQQYVTPKPVVYQQQYVTPKPVVYQQEIIQPVVTPKPVVYQQQYVTPKPVVYQQQVVTPKPVVYQQEIIQPVVTPKPVVYQQQYVTPKPVVYQQQYVTPKPVVYQQEIIQPVVTPKPVVYQQQYVTPKPVVYQQQVVTPKPVVYKQEIIQPVVTPKPVVYQQQYVTPKPVVYQQQVVTPKPVVYQQEIIQPVVTAKPVVYQQQYVTPKPVVYQQQYVTPKPVVYQQQVVTPKPVIYQQEIIQPVVTPKPIFYQRKYVTPKPVVYQQSVITPKPVVYQQSVITPKPVVYQQQVVKPAVTARPVFYQQEIAQPRPFSIQQKVIQPNPVVYQQQVVTPKPVVYEQQQQIITPRPVVYQKEIIRPAIKQVEYQQDVTPVVYQQQQIVTQKPVVYQQEINQPIVTPTPVVNIYPKRLPTTPKAVLYQQVFNVQTPQPITLRKKPVVYQEQQVVQPVVTYQQEIVTPRPVVYQKQQPVVYKQNVVTSNQAIYQQEIITPKPVVYEQEIITPKPIEYAQRIPVKRVKPVVYQQNYQIPEQQLTFQQDYKIVSTEQPTVYQEVTTPKTVVNYEVPQQIVPLRQDYIKVKTQRPVIYQETPQQEIQFQQDIVNYESPRIYEQRRKNIALVQTTPRPTFIETITPTVTYQKENIDYQPIVVSQTPKIKVGRIQTTPKTVYVESYERRNPGVAILEKEVYQPIDVVTSTRAPIVVQSFKGYEGYSGEEYLPPVTQENLELQKLEQVDVTTAQPLLTISETPKYGVNTRIEIAPPPEGYLLETPSTTSEPVTSTRYTLRPRTRVRVRPVTTTEASREYLPPTVESRRRGNGRGKTTIVSIGQVDKAEVDDQNIEGVLNKYSGKYGEISDDDKEKFVTKIIQGNERGTIRLGKEPEVSTVGYEITSSRARSRGRGGSRKSSSSSTTTTEDYEEESVVSSTQSTDTDDNQDIDNGDISLATLDLKNLKIKKNKKTVIVVSQVSDANPILIGKLAGQCSCQSNKVDLRSKGRRPSGRRNNDNDENDEDGNNPGDTDGSDDSDDDNNNRGRNSSPRGRNRSRGRPQDDRNDGEYGDESTTTRPARRRLSKARRPNSLDNQDGDDNGRKGGARGRRPDTSDDGNSDGSDGGNYGRKGGARGRRPNTSSEGDSPYGDDGNNDGSNGNGRTDGGRGRRPDDNVDDGRNSDGSNGDDGNSDNGVPDDRLVVIDSTGRNRGRQPIYLDNIAIEDGPNAPGQYNVEILNEDGSPTGLTSTTTILPEISSSILLPLAPSRRRPVTESAVSLPEKTTARRIPSRSRARVPFVPSTSPLLTPITADEIASTVDYAKPGVSNDISAGSAGEPSKVRAGAAFDRYGPGGWRSADETLQGSVDCKRAGLFRHPKYCNKFYSCNYDPWKKRFTLSVFNCPVHLAYDSNIGACNWPSKGPACADDNLLV